MFNFPKPDYDPDTELTSAILASFERKTWNDSKMFVYALLKLLGEADITHLTAAHAYYHARKYHNIARIERSDEWNKLVGPYSKEIQLTTAKNIHRMFYTLAKAFREYAVRYRTELTRSLTEHTFRQLKERDTGFSLSRRMNDESLVLDLKTYVIHGSITREHKYNYTVDQVEKMFDEFLKYCLTVPSSEEEFLKRASVSAIKSILTQFELLFQLFLEEWVDFTQVYLEKYSDGSKYNEPTKKFIRTYPVRSVEAVLDCKFDESYGQMSLDLPVEVHGIVDQYLGLGYNVLGRR